MPPPAEADTAPAGDTPSQRRRDALLLAWAILKTIARLAAVWAAAHWGDVVEVIKRR